MTVKVKRYEDGRLHRNWGDAVYRIVLAATAVGRSGSHTLRIRQSI